MGNHAEAYTSEMDFHSASKLQKLTYPIKVIYSKEARKKIRQVLDDFKPDVCHLNNFNYQLTPSIILELHEWKKESHHKCMIIYTAHDYQLVCPNHLCNNPNTNENCEKCLGGHYINCAKNKCIHGSTLRSLLGTAEAVYWNRIGVYKLINRIICCSKFMKSKLDTNPVLAKKTISLHNFIDKIEPVNCEKKDYVLYFGRYSREKGINTLISVARDLPEVNFVFAGSGPLEESINKVPNIKNVGFKSGEDLEILISEARFTVCPSEWYENCPFSVMESQMYGTPVLGANIGGIPELIINGETGELFISGSKKDLKDKILFLWEDKERTNMYAQNCKNTDFDTVDQYYNKIMKIYSK